MNRLRVFLLLLLATSVFHFAIDSFAQPVKPLRGRGGGSNGGSSGGSTDTETLIRWCRTSVSTLETYLDLSKRLYRNGNKTAAHAKLIEGLEVAQKKFERPVQSSINETVSLPLTAKAIENGMTLTAAFDDLVEQDKDNTTLFLMEYYQSIIKVAETIDVRVYIPRHWSYSNPSRNRPTEEDFENQYVKYAEYQLSWLLTHFTYKLPIGSDGIQYYAAYNISRKALLKALELVTSFSSESLFSDLQPARVACLKEGLENLNQQLSDFNQGNHSIGITDDGEMVDFAVQRMIQFQEKLKNNCGI